MMAFSLALSSMLLFCFDANAMGRETASVKEDVVYAKALSANKNSAVAYANKWRRQGLQRLAGRYYYKLESVFSRYTTMTVKITIQAKEINHIGDTVWSLWIF